MLDRCVSHLKGRHETLSYRTGSITLQKEANKIQKVWKVTESVIYPSVEEPIVTPVFGEMKLLKYF